MKICRLLPWVALLIFVLGLTACLPRQTGTAVPTASSNSLPTEPTAPADTIFYNGILITIEADQPVAQAIAIRNGLIQAVGPDEEVLAYQGSDTALIDLQGRTLMPGFIDGHSHTLVFPGRMSATLEEAQEVAIDYGFTTLNEMWADTGFIHQLMAAEADGDLRLRVNVFASYNDGVLDENRDKVIMQTWFPENGPILDPGRHLRIPGIKIFLDGDEFTPARGCWALSEPHEPNAPVLQSHLCGTPYGDLYWTQEELNQVVAQAQEAGFRVSFHAMGDQAIEQALNAIEFALDGRPNSEVRHQIQHSSLARPDQVARYAELDVLASVRGYADFCDLSYLADYFGEDRVPWYVDRYALATQGSHAYVETDFGWTIPPEDRYSQRSLDPIMQLYGLVTHRYVAPDGTICDPDPLVLAYPVSVERALQMLTIETAYAVSMEDYIGSLRPGKYADLIMLSGDPLTMDPEDLKDLRVLMTVIDGQVEYCLPDQVGLVPGCTE